MSTPTSSETEDSFVRGFHGIPDDKALGAMSFTQLASLLAGCEIGSPKFIVLEREMKKHLAKDQARINRSNILVGALIAGLFALLGAGVGGLLRSPLHTPIVGPTQGSSTAMAVGADEAIRRVDNCVCSRSAEGQQLQPWELAWNDPAKLRQHFSHCVCQAHIDLKAVADPKRYVTPGTVVK